MKKSNLRMVAIIDQDGIVKFGFSKEADDTHRKIYQRISNEDGFKRNFDIAIYGRFYSLLYGNSKYPLLIIYGESSDYRLEELGHHQDKYEKALRDFAYTSKYDILFLS